MEVTLEQDPSGIWKAPRPPKKQLAAWQRLWIATGLAWLLMLAGSWYVIMPTRSSIDRTMVFAVTEEVRRYNGLAFAGESPKRIFEIARSKGYDHWIVEVRTAYRIGAEGNAGFERIGKQHRDALSRLPFQQAAGVFACLVAWVLPMGIFYAAGRVIDWIKRGVRGKEHD